MTDRNFKSFDPTEDDERSPMEMDFYSFSIGKMDIKATSHRFGMEGGSIRTPTEAEALAAALLGWARDRRAK